MTVRTRVLRGVALIGVMVVLLQEAVAAFPLKPRQEYGIVVLVLALLGVGLTLRLLLPGTIGQLLRHKDLFVPLGLLTLANAALGWPGSTTVQSKTDFSVNGFWTGGYENECRWYSKLMQVLETPALAVISTSLGLVFGVLAVAIKLRISEDIVPPAERVIFNEPT